MSTSLDIAALFAVLQTKLTAEELAHAPSKVMGESGLQVRVEGEHCLTSIGVWPNGCCDVDYLYTESEEGQFRHYEFGSVEEALSAVVTEVRAAIERSRNERGK
ncbi:hypothetical protein [Flavobacterium sp.]|jgi:hypothetical protein|uniref:hypothetical protein n=1 Tax=Flavobacterium sp. TaxID=239 RepID=UPI0037BFC607